MEPACRIADPRPKAYGCRVHFSTRLGFSIELVYTQLKILALFEERLALKCHFPPTPRPEYVKQIALQLCQCTSPEVTGSAPF